MESMLLENFIDTLNGIQGIKYIADEMCSKLNTAKYINLSTGRLTTIDTAFPEISNEQAKDYLYALGQKDIADILFPDTYYTTKTIYGVISELGATSLNAIKKHINIDGIGYKIKISKDQDIELKPHYATDKLKIRIKQKRSLEKGRIIDAELISFIKVNDNSIIDNLKNEGYVDFALIKDTHTIDDLLNRIYG